MSYILEALKKVDLRRAKRRGSINLKEGILGETAPVQKWYRRSIWIPILAVILVLGLSIGLFLSREEGTEGRKSLKRSKTSQAKVEKPTKPAVETVPPAPSVPETSTHKMEVKIPPPF